MHRCHCGAQFDTVEELFDHIDAKGRRVEAAGDLCKRCGTQPVVPCFIEVRDGERRYKVKHKDLCADCRREFQVELDGRVKARGGPR